MNAVNERKEHEYLLLTNTTPAALSVGGTGALLFDSSQEQFSRWWLR
jgi:hypothetical protein